MKLVLARLGPFLCVERWEEWMGKCLTFELIDQSPHTDKNGKPIKGGVRYQKCCYWYEPSDGSARFLAGLLPEFTKAAATRGYEVEVIDCRDPNPNNIKPVWDDITASFRHKQEEVLDAITKADKGIIKCSVGFGKSFLIKTICALYPTARIVICTAARTVVDQIYKNVSELLGKNEVGKLCSGTPDTEEDKRVVVSTMRSLIRARLSDCDFLLFDECHNVGDNQAFQFLVDGCKNCRMFGFTASLSRGDGALPLIKGLFGTVIATCSYQEAQEHGMVTKIKAIMVNYPHTKNTKVTGHAWLDQRIHYWQNFSRNKAIAEFTAQLPPDAQTLIMVEKIEQAVCLKRFPQLQEWPILFSGDLEKEEVKEYAHTTDSAPDFVDAVDKQGNAVTLVKFIGDTKHFPGFRVLETNDFYTFTEAMKVFKVKGTKDAVARIVRKPNVIAGVPATDLIIPKPKIKQMIADFGSGKIRKAIATTVLKEGVDLFQLQCLIRADGASSKVFNTQVPGRLSRLFKGKEFALLVDFYDDDNPWMLGRTHARMRLYKEQGWLK